MPTVINTNLASLFAQNSLSNAQNNLATSVQRLSSGLRINSAKDDAAGLSISQSMQSQINGTNQSIRNLSDATNLLQTADSSLSTVQDMMLRLKQLATQGYDGSLSTSQKLNIVQEMKDLNNEINATAARTNFNGINLLSSGSSVDLNSSDIKAGTALTSTTPSVTLGNASFGVGYFANGGSAPTVGLADAALGLSSGNFNSGPASIATTYRVELDSEMAPKIAGNYEFSSTGSALTIRGTINGQSASQTISVADAPSNPTGGNVRASTQTLDFNNFGVKLVLNSTRAGGDTLSGSTIASQLASSNYRNLQIGGVNGEVSDVRLSGVNPGTYNLTYNETGTVNSLSLPANITARVTANAAAGTLFNIALTGGSVGSSGATADLTYDATGKITGVSINNKGTGYKAGDVLGIDFRGAVYSPVMPAPSVDVAAVAGTAVTAAVVANIAVPVATTGSASYTETSAITFAALGLQAGQSLTVAGLTFTAAAAVTGAQLASAFENLTAGATGASAANAAATALLGSYSGSLTGFNTGVVANMVIQATSTTPFAPVADLAVSASAYGVPSSVTITSGSNGVTPATEIAVISFGAGGLTAGQSMTIAGLTFTAAGVVTQAQLGAAFEGLSSGATGASAANAAATALLGRYSGTLTAYNTSALGVPAANQIRATSTTANNNVENIVVTMQGNKAVTGLTGIVVGKDIAITGGEKTLTMKGTVNGVETSETLDVSNNGALKTQTFNFKSFGAQFDVTSFQGQSASQIGTALATLNGLNGTSAFGNPGQLVVSQGSNSALKFQSGATSDAYIQIDTLNIQTGTTGLYAGTASQMTTLGNRITNSRNGDLGNLGLTDSISVWQTAFRNAAAAVDNALEFISTQRATYGSQMNRLSYVSTNLQAQSTNLQNSRSAIIDTDFAAETAKLTKGQIMQQAATAMLAQANQMPNVILSLLK
jgi:flagellin-like hook-associated protein FlgL